MRQSLDLLESVHIANPCRVSWDRMTGNEQARHCSRCQQTVYNLSTMTTLAAANLLSAHGKNACVRFYRRADGTVVTRDCPPSPQRRFPRLWRLALAFAAWFGFTLLPGCSRHQGKPHFPSDDKSPKLQKEAECEKKDAKTSE